MNDPTIFRQIDTFDGAKPRFLNRGRKRRSVSTLSIPRASDRGVEWVDFLLSNWKCSFKSLTKTCSVPPCYNMVQGLSKAGWAGKFI